MPKINNPRLLLAHLRQGDFAHAGDKEAIDIVLKKAEEFIDLHAQSKALDVGCGLGGTAAYIKTQTSLDISGVDVDTAAISHAQSIHQDMDFKECDVMVVDKKFPQDYFCVIYLFNVLYAIPQQEKSLKHLAIVGKEGALLIIFDYTSNTAEESFDTKDLADKPMRPVNLSKLKIWLQNSNWDLLEIVDLTAEYKRWYREFLEKMTLNRENLLEIFSEEAFLKVYNTFSVLLENLDNGKISGSAVYARLNKNGLFKAQGDDKIAADKKPRPKF